MGGVAAIVGSTCCCGDPVDPCDCELTSVQLDWSGSMDIEWSCTCVFPGPEAVLATTISGVSITCEKNDEVQNCPYVGETSTDTGELPLCSGGGSGKYLRIIAIGKLTKISGFGWQAEIDWKGEVRQVGTNTLLGTWPFARCITNPILYDAWRFRGPNASCPTGDYDHEGIPSGCTTIVGGPNCGPAALTAIGVTDVDFGAVTVS